MKNYSNTWKFDDQYTANYSIVFEKNAMLFYFTIGIYKQT